MLSLKWRIILEKDIDRKKVMIILKKPKDTYNEFSTSSIEMKTDAETVVDILEDVKCFLIACGYPINWDATLVVQEIEELKEVDDET